MGFTRKAGRLSIAVSLIFLLTCLPVRGQQDNPQTPTPKEGPPKAAGATTPINAPATGNTTDEILPTNPGPPEPYAGQLKEAGNGLPLYGTSTTPLRWGDFSIGSFEYIGIHDSFDPVGPAPGPWTNITIFRTSLMFDHYIKKDRIVLQYLPQMAILNGEVHANAGANNSVAFGMSFDLTPRLNLTVQNVFTQVHSNDLIPENYLAADAFAGAVVQNNFLDTNGSFIADTASATATYRFSPRTTLTVSPMFRYAKATTNQVNYTANGNTYQGIVTLGHALTPRRSVGLMESYQLLEQSGGGGPVSAHYYTSGGFYSEQLARALWVTGYAGAEHQSYSDLPQAGNWGFSAGASLVESFSQNLGLTLAYTRGIAFNNYLTTRRSDRVDAEIGFHLLARLAWNNGGGYFRELGTDPRTSGKYLTSNMNYKLTTNFSAFSSFSYSFQNSNTPQLLSGLRRTLSWGLLWEPPRDLPH